MSTQPVNVLFLCTGNSARSIMAEALLSQLGAPQFKAYSAGSHPKGQINPRVIALLRSLDFGVESLRSKGWNEFSASNAPKLDIVITVCSNAANEACPVWAGDAISSHWDVPDPAADGEDALGHAWHVLHAHITALCAVPVASLGPAAVREKLLEIGRS